jgi:hypothetical protein
MKHSILAGCAIMLSVATAHAGPCNTGGKDAGSGPTPGYTGQTVGTASSDTKEHPPTATMNRVIGEKAASSQDTQRPAHRCATGSRCQAADAGG